MDWTLVRRNPVMTTPPMASTVSSSPMAVASARPCGVHEVERSRDEATTIHDEEKQPVRYFRKVWRKCGCPACWNRKDMPEEVLEGVARVPEDVRRLLVGIADRNRERKVMFPEVPVEMKERRADGPEGEDPRMRVLDEL